MVEMCGKLLRYLVAADPIHNIFDVASGEFIIPFFNQDHCPLVIMEGF